MTKNKRYAIGRRFGAGRLFLSRDTYFTEEEAKDQCVSQAASYTGRGEPTFVVVTVSEHWSLNDG